MVRVMSLRLRERQVKILALALIVALPLTYAYLTYSYAAGISDYISDECWYVSAARNTLTKYLGLRPPSSAGKVVVTVELVKSSIESEYLKTVADVKKYIVSDLNGSLVKDESYYKFKSDGKFLPALCAEISPELLSNLSSHPSVRRVAVGYCYPNAEGILDYMNFEHPPLVKYFIALTMISVGDSPSLWRIPSVIAGALVLVVIFLIFREVIKDNTWLLLGFTAALITAFDKTFRSLSMVAMLDIFVSLFTILTLYFTLRGKLSLASVSIGLGFVSKFSGAFPALPATLYWVRRDKPAKVFLLIIYVPIVMLIILGTPYILRDGFLQWWSSSVEGAFRWHLSVKTTNGPPQAMPWDWLIGRNPFPLHYVWDPSKGEFVADLIASGNPILYLLTAALSILVIPVIKDLPDRGVSYSFTWLTYLTYVALWLLGGKTQYSFYSVQVVPLFYVTLVMLIYYLITPHTKILDVLRKWREIINTISMWLAGEVSISLKLVVSKKE
ncbi:MAG: glycosyltransferase family 39 protein [Zestosphaera sp.]